MTKPGAGSSEIPRSGGAGAERLARRVHRQHPEITYTRAKRAVEAGQVTVEGNVVQEPGAVVDRRARVDWNPNRKAVARPMRRNVQVLHADDDVVVAVKPAGLLTSPTPEREQDTLLSRVSLWLARGTTERPYVAVVHRLDKETSGLVVFATSRRGLERLQAQLEDHTLGRVYEALLEGDLAGDAGTWDRALIGDGTHRRRWVVRPEEVGKAAVTHWSVVKRFGIATLVRVVLETGRTHQIRIHSAFHGHPVVGDKVYRQRDRTAFPITFARQALHALELSFHHPADGRPLRFRAPHPEDFVLLLRKVAGKGRSRPVPVPLARPARAGRREEAPGSEEKPARPPRRQRAGRDGTKTRKRPVPATKGRKRPAPAPSRRPKKR